MVKHGMDMVREAIQHLNPGQIPVIAVDQPIFSLAKCIQWKCSPAYGEEIFVVKMGGLHIKMALWSSLGDILANSDWTAVLTEAGVAISGSAQSFLTASHLKRTR